MMFQPITINNVVLKNRFVFAAADDNLNKDVYRRVQRYAALAAGGVGLIVSGATTFADSEGWRKVIDAVHHNGGKIFCQLVPTKIFDRMVSRLPADNEYFSPLMYPYREHQAFSEEEIFGFIEQYVERAALARQLGADGVEIHAAHHSIPATFLSPYTNQRSDSWGGSLENRLRFHKEVYKAVRAKVGADFPLIIKLGVEDAIAKGLRFEEGRQAAAILAEHGFDAVEVSQGLMIVDTNMTLRGMPMRTGIIKPEQEAYFRDWSREIKKEISKPVILTGGMFSYETVKKLIDEGYADMVSMCRALIRESGLVERWQQGDIRRATCVACNKCTFELLSKGLPLECYLDLLIRKKAARNANL